MNTIKITDEVVKATREDLRFVLAWLKSEYNEDGSSFWCNRKIIKKALKEHDTFWVIRRNAEAVAFQVGQYSADILSVHKNYRNSGLAKYLLEASIRRAEADNVNVIAVECAPQTSLGFWKRMGFERYRRRLQPSALTVRRVLSRTFSFPSNLPTVGLVIGFYPEKAACNLHRNTPPIAEHSVTGVLDQNGTIMLERSVIGLCDDEPDDRDLLIKIEVDGVERHFEKAKRQAAEDVGVLSDGVGKTSISIA